MTRAIRYEVAIALALVVIVALAPALVAAGGGGGARTADEIDMTPAQIETLGIATAKPEAVREWQTPAYPASVVTPPDRTVAVTAPLEGLVRNLKLAFGDRVSAGQEVATISSPSFLELQRTFLQSLNDLNLAKTELARDTQMAREELIPQRRLQTTQARHTEVSTRAEELRRALHLAGLDDAEIDKLSRSRVLVPYLSLRSPISGVVTERLAEAGQQVGRSAPLYRISDLSVLWAEMNVPVEIVGTIGKGARVGITAREGDERGAEGRVISIGPVVNPQSQTVTVRAEISQPGGLVRPGQNVRARILGTATGGTFRVPITALVRSGESRYVFIRTGTGFRAQPVTVATSDERFAVVTGGLTDDEIAVKGTAAIKGRQMGLGGGD